MNYLLDSGGKKSLIPLSRLPKSIPKHNSVQPYSTLSSSGVNQHHEYITLSKIRFRQFSTNIWLENVELIIFDDSKYCAYDIILGRNTAIRIRIHHLFREKRNFVPQRHTSVPSTYHENIYRITHRTKFTTASTNCTHDQQEQLNAILSKFPQLFANDIGKSRHYVKLQLIDPHTTPIHSNPFAIPNAHHHHFNKIITDLVANNVLRKIISSKWAFPSFLVP